MGTGTVKLRVRVLIVNAAELLGSFLMNFACVRQDCCFSTWMPSKHAFDGKDATIDDDPAIVLLVVLFDFFTGELFLRRVARLLFGCHLFFDAGFHPATITGAGFDWVTEQDMRLVVLLWDDDLGLDREPMSALIVTTSVCEKQRSAEARSYPSFRAYSTTDRAVDSVS